MGTVDIKKCTLLNGKDENTKFIYPKTSVDMVEYDETKNMDTVLNDINTDISSIRESISNFGTYSKPTDGIPKSDLSSDVQQSLDKAESALQSFTEEDPTVPSHVKNITSDNISKWDGYESEIESIKQSVNNSNSYSKPADGIPKNDLTSDVQESLSKAESALQSFTEEDPTVPSHVKSISEEDIDNWNSNKTEIESIKQSVNNFGTYSKPTDGIPKSDLSSDIQDSLDKADSALQSFTEEDPTVPSHVKSISEEDITKWDGISDIDSSLTAQDNLKFKFSTDGNGNYGYLKSDNSFAAFGSGSGGSGIVISNEEPTQNEGDMWLKPV